MKIFSADPVPPLVDRSKAWSCLVTNLLVLPGLGSIMAKRRFAGSMQMVLAFLGFAITLVALCRIVLLWAQAFVLPNQPDLYRAAMLGIVVFLFSWIWSLATSLTLFRGAKPKK